MTDAVKSVRAIFDEASEIGDAEQRRAFVSHACGGNAPLRREVD